MKKIAIYSVLAVSLLAAEPALAQKSKVTTAIISMRNGDLVKAKEAINEAANNEATKGDPKTWLYRGQIYRSIYENPKLRETEPNALQEAHTSIMKGVELDVANKNSDLKSELRDLALVYYDEGSAAYNAKNYENAYKNFDIYLTSLNKLDAGNRKKIEDLLKANKINPLSAKLYTAYSAQQINNNEKAISYYNELVNDKFDDVLVYMSLADLHKAAGDTAAAIAILDKGMGNVTDKKSLLIDKLNIYIARGQTKEALKLGQDALTLDPKNISLYIAMGNIYDNLKMGKEAEELYNKALALDPESFSTNYSLGMSFFNQGADKYNESIKEKNAKKSEDQLNAAKERFRKAIPYLEKAHGQKPAEKDVIQVLAEIYAKLDDFDKSKTYRDKLKK
ncbi:MAG: tetratricopeptide repeat protein [Bacteroidia bacterium]